MKPTEYEMKQLWMQERRLRAFKERNWKETFSHDPRKWFMTVLLLSIFCGLGMLFILLNIFA